MRRSPEDIGALTVSVRSGRTSPRSSTLSTNAPLDTVTTGTAATSRYRQNRDQPPAAAANARTRTPAMTHLRGRRGLTTYLPRPPDAGQRAPPPRRRYG